MNMSHCFLRRPFRHDSHRRKFLRWRRTAWFSIGVLLGVTCSATAERETDQDSPDPMSKPLVTDRPDFTESTESIPLGHAQLEAGYTFTFDRESTDRSREHTTPELLLRIGLSEGVELRIGWDGYLWTESQFETKTRSGRSVTRENWSQGAADLSLGIKKKLLEQEGWIPHFGVLGTITLPSGSAGISSGDVDPELVLLWAYDLHDSLAIAGNVGLGMPSENGTRFLQTSASISLAVSVTDRLGTYVEYFGIYPNAEGSNSAHTLNGGITYLISNDFQLDARVGAGLNEEASDFFTGVGFSWRF